MGRQTGCENASSHYLWLDISNISPSAEAVILVCTSFLCDSCHRRGHAGYLFVTPITGVGAGGTGAGLRWCPGPQAGVGMVVPGKTGQGH